MPPTSVFTFTEEKKDDKVRSFTGGSHSFCAQVGSKTLASFVM